MKKKVVLFVAVFVCCTSNSSTYTYDECVKLTLSPGDYKKWLNDEIELSRYSELIKKCLDEEIVFAEETVNKNNADKSNTTTTQLSETSSSTTSTSTTTNVNSNISYSQNAINAYIELFTDQGEGIASKWQKDTVKIYIGGDPSIIQRDTFNYVVGDFNRIIDNISFELTNSFGDINFYFGDLSSWQTSQSLEMKECQPYRLVTDSRVDINTYMWNQINSGDKSISLVCIYVYSQSEYTFDLPSASEKAIETCAIWDIRVSLALSVFYPSFALNDEIYGPGVYSDYEYCNPDSTAFSPIDEELLMIHYDPRLNNLTSLNEVLERVKTFNK
tara:strand:+ start:950 stop:1939 length:990 start_codon:yes stop_codon:yes gene_type:complete